MLEFVLARANYWAIIALMMVGLYIAFQSTNLIKRLVGLSIFQTSVFLFYITLGKIAGGTAPILFGDDLAGHGSEAGHGEAESHEGAGPVAVPELPDETPAVTDGADAGGAEPLTGELDGIEGATDAPFAAGPEHGGEALPVGTGNPGGLEEMYSNPLPHVLILTAIVVGVATLAVGLAIVVRIREAYGSIESDEVREMDIDMADAQDADDALPGGAG